MEAQRNDLPEITLLLSCGFSWVSLGSSARSNEWQFSVFRLCRGYAVNLDWKPCRVSSSWRATLSFPGFGRSPFNLLMSLIQRHLGGSSQIKDNHGFNNILVLMFLYPCC